MNVGEDLPVVYGDSGNEEDPYRRKDLSRSALGPMEPDVLREEGAGGYNVAKFVILFGVISLVLISFLDLVIGWLWPIIAPLASFMFLIFEFMFLIFGLVVIAKFVMSAQYMT